MGEKTSKMEVGLSKKKPDAHRNYGKTLNHPKGPKCSEHKISVAASFFLHYLPLAQSKKKREFTFWLLSMHILVL
jgi:hypothetical protein